MKDMIRLQFFHRLLSHERVKSIIAIIRNNPFRIIVISTIIFAWIENIFYYQLLNLLSSKRKIVNRLRIPNKEIRDGVNQIQSIEIANSAFLKLPAWKLAFTQRNEKKETRIQLATGLFVYSDLIFSQRFEDIEDEFSVHRFNWLLLLLQKEKYSDSVELGYESIQFWIRNFTNKQNIKGYEPYSTSERLVNWLFFLLLTSKSRKSRTEFWYEIKDSIQIQLHYLIHNLEYYGKYTNNHLLNNARALYICGRLLGLATIEELGKKIIVERVSILLKEGFVQEDSTHYQMLITKWILDIYLVTDEGDFLRSLKKILDLMLKVNTETFSENNDCYPLFGDISPDLIPEYFKGYPFKIDSNKKSIWFELFETRIEKKLNPISSKDYPSDEKKNLNRWNKVKYLNWEVWTICKQNGIVGHGHDDNGSNSIFYNGIPIIHDPGMMNYKKDNPFRVNQKSRENHFCQGVENVYFDFYLPSKNHSSSICSNVEYIRDESKISTILTSFDQTTIVQRRIEFLESDSMVIEDSIVKSKSKKYFTQLVLDMEYNDISLLSNCAFIEVEDLKFKIEFQNYNKIHLNEYYSSRVYGEKKKKPLIRIESDLKLDEKLVMKISKLN